MASSPRQQVHLASDPNPLEVLRATLDFAVDDWGESRAKAWVYGIVLGWSNGAADELAERYSWSPDTVATLRRLHDAFDAIEAGGGGR